MLKTERTSVMNLENAIRGARNPMNSWAKSDSRFDEAGQFVLGPADLALAERLCRAGSDHRKFIRQIFVSVDITAPLYWWKEYDTYKVGTVANSCSTMHKIHAKEFTLDDFSYEHLMPFAKSHLKQTIKLLNEYREEYLRSKNKRYWWQLIQLLPSSYNQKRTVQLNYEVLNTMYHARKNHKLDEWHTLCDEISKLPYSEFITMEFEGVE